MNKNELKAILEKDFQNTLKISLSDFDKGVVDCKLGIYDKWFRYNRKDDGYAYDKGWFHQNKSSQNDMIKFIEVSVRY